MLNKNVADYTNFDGKTNKKIVQAPGGLSSFSIGWDNDRIDYGPERVFKKKDNVHNYNDMPPRQPPPSYQKPPPYNYNEPIRVLDDRPSYEQQSIPQRQESYAPYTAQSTGSSQSSKKYGGEYGYGNYAPEEVTYQPRPKQQAYQQDSLDLVKEQFKGKVNGSMQVPRVTQNVGPKACIKIHEQANNNIFGSNNYNYWKQPTDDRKYSNQSSKRPPLYEQPIQQQQQQVYPEKTSVKVHNPPGGKSSISFG